MSSPGVATHSLIAQRCALRIRHFHDDSRIQCDLLKNAVDVFGLAKNLGIDIRQLYDVITVRSGSGAVLQSVGSQINSETAVHIQKLMRKDIEHFADAMRASRSGS